MPTRTVRLGSIAGPSGCAGWSFRLASSTAGPPSSTTETWSSVATGGRVETATRTVVAAFTAVVLVRAVTLTVSASTPPARSPAVVVRPARQVVVAPGSSCPPSGTGEQTRADSPGAGSVTSRSRRVTLPRLRATNVYPIRWPTRVRADAFVLAVSERPGPRVAVELAVAVADALIVVPPEVRAVAVTASVRLAPSSTSSWVTVSVARQVVDAPAARLAPTATGAQVRAESREEASVTASPTRDVSPEFVTTEVQDST